MPQLTEQFVLRVAPRCLALVCKALQGEELLSVREHESGIVVAIGEGRLRVEIDQEAWLSLRRAQIGFLNDSK